MEGNAQQEDGERELSFLGEGEGERWRTQTDDVVTLCNKNRVDI